MSRDGNGTYNLPPGNPVVTETVISSTTHNTTMADVQAALTQSISKDGQTTYTSNQNMGGFHHTGVSDASARNHYASAGQVQDGFFTLIGSVSGTDTLTGTLSPAITSLATGTPLTIIPAFSNAGPATLALNGITAKPILKQGGTALSAGDLLAGVPAILTYNGTAFYLAASQGAQAFTNLALSGNLSVAGTTTLTGNVSAGVIGAGSVSTVGNVNVGGAAAITGALSVGGNVAITGTVNGVAVSDFARLSQANTFAASITQFRADNVGDVSVVVASSTNGNALYRATTFGVTNWSLGNERSTGDWLLCNAVDISSGIKLRATAAGDLQLGGISIRNASILNTGTLNNAQVAQSNVTQYQAALAINNSQCVSDVNNQTASFAVASTMAGDLVDCDSASTITVTVGNNCLGADGKAAIFTRQNTGAVTFSASGVTINSPGGGLSITVRYGKVGLVQKSATVFELSGNV